MAETSHLEKKEKARKCKTCHVTFPDIYDYVDHLESKEHKKREMKLKYAEKYLEAKAKLDGKVLPEKAHEGTLNVNDSNEMLLKNAEEKQKSVKETSANTAKSSSSESSDDEDDEVYTCEPCEKVCTGLITYQLHLAGKKHSKRIKNIEEYNKLKKKHLLPDTTKQPKKESLFENLIPRTQLASSDIECSICNKKCSGPQSYKQHCKSEAHKKKAATAKKTAEVESEGKSSIVRKNSDGNVFYCDVCDKEFSGLSHYAQHMDSTAHHKQTRHNKDMDKFKDLIITSEEDSKIRCAECGKTFSGLVPFHDHIKSSVHKKLKTKSSLMESLEKKHPEMIKIVKGKTDDSDEESGILGCDVCHVVFSGPEAARDHFESSKHKKAKKEKAQFRKYKQQSESKKNKTEEEKDSNSDTEDEFDIIPSPTV